MLIIFVNLLLSVIHDGHWQSQAFIEKKTYEFQYGDFHVKIATLSEYILVHQEHI